MAEPTPRPTSGRRRAAASAGRRPGPLGVLAVVLPLLTLGALALVDPLAASDPGLAPDEAPLTRATLVCPRDLATTRGSRTPVRVGTTLEVEGEVTTRLPAGGVIDLDGTGGPALADLGEPGPVALVAEGDLAPGLVAGRPAPGAAVACTAPLPQQWFTGVGAGPRHSSVLELVNPDGGPAVADVSVLGPDGPVEVPALRGVTVAGGQAARFDLAELVPTNADLALGVSIVRGRLGAHVADTVDELDRDTRFTAPLSGQEDPQRASYLLGLGSGRGERTLTVANPGDDDGRVAVRVVTPESEFAPGGLDELVVPARSVATLDLSDVLGARGARDAIGLRLDATVPVTASLRSVLAGSRAQLVRGTVGSRVETRGVAVVPRGAKRLLLAGADALGVAEVRQFTARGRALEPKRVELDPGRSLRVRLAPSASTVEVRLERTDVVATVETDRGGVAEIPLTTLVEDALVPRVRPALP